MAVAKAFVVVLAFLSASAQARDSGVDAIGPVQSDYVPRGTTIPFGDLNVYFAFPGVSGSGTKAVVWGHDIYGPTSGRTYELVDQLAAETEYLVLLPDFFRGEMLPPYDKYSWADYLQVR